MCSAIKVRGKVCMTMDELRKALYPDAAKIVFEPGYGSEARRKNGCLCPVDLNATAAALGLVVAEPASTEYFAFVPATK